MIKSTLSLLVIMLICSCSVIQLKTSTTDPVTKQLIPCHITRAALFMSNDKISGSACGGTVAAEGSKADTDLLAVGIKAGIDAVKGR